jgi:hypothetical protein
MNDYDRLCRKLLCHDLLVRLAFTVAAFFLGWFACWLAATMFQALEAATNTVMESLAFVVFLSSILLGLAGLVLGIVPWLSLCYDGPPTPTREEWEAEQLRLKEREYKLMPDGDLLKYRDRLADRCSVLAWDELDLIERILSTRKESA